MNFIVVLLLSIILQISLAQLHVASNVRDVGVVTLLVDPYLKLVPNSSLHGNDQYEGFLKDFADKVFEKLGLTYKFKLATNGTYDGIIFDLVSNRSDMAIADLSVTSERSELVDFSVAFMESLLGILVKRPDHESKSLEILAIEDGGRSYPWFRPFTIWLWLAIIFTLLIHLLLIFFVEKIVSRKISKVQPPTPESFFARFGTRVFGAPRSIATRFLQVLFWIFIIFTISAYISNFSADKILEVVHQSEIEKPLIANSLEDLLEKDKIKIGILKNGATHRYLSASTDEQISKLFDKVQKNGSFVNSYDDGKSRVRNDKNGTFVFIMESPAARYATIRKPCDLSLVPTLFGPRKGFAVAVRKESKKINLSRLNSVILELSESGILDSITEKWFKDQSECEEPVKGGIWMERKYSPMTLENLGSLFILLTIAIFVIFIVAGIETGISRKV